MILKTIQRQLFVEYLDHHEKCIQISTNMPSMVLVNRSWILNFLWQNKCWLTSNVIMLTLTMRQACADDRSKMSQNCHNFVKILTFCDHIWIHNEKCIHISTNMPNINPVQNSWIGFEICNFLEDKTSIDWFLMW